MRRRQGQPLRRLVARDRIRPGHRVTIYPGNHGTELDAHQGAVLLFDGNSGSLLAVIDGSEVTAIRTAAVSGVATDVLARPDPASWR